MSSINLEKTSNIDKAIAVASQSTGTEFNSEEIIDCLEMSILTGEHYEQDVIVKIERLKRIVSSLNEELHADEVANAELLRQLVFLETRYIRQYESLVLDIASGQSYLLDGKDGILIDPKKSHNYYFLKDLKELFPDLDTLKISRYTRFLINIALAYMDDYLESNETTRIELSNLRSLLDDETGEKINKLTSDKVEFLKYKVEYRLSKSDKTSKLLPPISKNNAFIQFYDKIHLHFDGNPEVESLEKKIKNFDAVKINDIELEPFHHLNRYYRKLWDTDPGKSEHGISILLDAMNNIMPLIKSLTTYDQIAVKSVYKLVRNSKLAIDLKDLEKNKISKIIASFQAFLVINGVIDADTELKVLKSKIDETSNASNFPDYYCYLTFIRFLDKIIDEFIQHPSKIISSEFFEKNNQDTIAKNIEPLVNHISDVYSTAMTQLKINLKLMLSHKVRAVGLTKKETYSHTDDYRELTPDGIFLDSSYILPINFNEIRNEVLVCSSLLNPKINNLKYALEIVLNRLRMENKNNDFDKKINDNQQEFKSFVTESKKSIEDETKKISEESKKYEMRIVQIVAMFVSIATFVLINVKIFDNKSGLESFAITLGIAACFTLFNLFFHEIYLTPAKEKIKDSGIESTIQIEAGKPDPAIVPDKETSKIQAKEAKSYPVTTTLKITIVILLIVSFGLLMFERGRTQGSIEDFRKRLDKDSVFVYRSVHTIDSMQRVIDYHQKLQGLIIDSIIQKRGNTIFNNNRQRKSTLIVNKN